MGFLKALYHGDLRLDDRIASEPGPYLESRSDLYKFCEELENKIPEEYREEFETLMDLAGESAAAAEEAAFAMGVKFACNLFFEILK